MEKFKPFGQQLRSLQTVDIEPKKKFCEVKNIYCQIIPMRKYQSSIYLSFIGLALLIGSSSINPAARLIRDEAIAGSHATTNELLSSLSFSLRREEDES